MSDDLTARISVADPRSLLPAGRDVGVEHGRSCTLLDDADLGDGRALAVVRDDGGRHFCVPLVTGDEVRRARPGEGASQALVAALDRGLGGGFTVTRWHDEVCDGERGVTVDQTNESVIVGDRAVVKWAVETSAEHPAPARLSALMAAGFTGMPRPWAMVEWQPGPDEPSHLLATVVDYLPGAVDGWRWAVDDLRTAAETGSRTPVRETATTLGSLVADMHTGLASAGTSAMAAEHANAWRDAAVAELTDALALTRGLPGERLTATYDVFRAHIEHLGAAAGTPLADVHGDLHVGQVLRYGPDDSPRYAVTDFDGNPVLDASERLAPQPAAVDVAGMLQSFENAGHVVVRRTDGVDTTAVAAVVRDASAAFLAAYRDRLERHGMSWLFDPALVGPLRARQICREYLYAAKHLERWRYVPDAAAAALQHTEG